MYNLELCISILSKTFGINIFILKDEKIIFDTHSDQNLCHKCPKSIFNSCLKDWIIGKEISEKLHEPYFYLCPLNMTLVIISLDSHGNNKQYDFFCFGPIVIESSKQYFEENIKSLQLSDKEQKNIKQISILNDFQFHNYASIAYFAINGSQNYNVEKTYKTVLLNEEISYNIEVYKKLSHNMDNVFNLENKILHCIQASDRKEVLPLLKRLMSVVHIEESLNIEQIKKKFIQVYYLIHRKSIECEARYENAIKLNKTAMESIHHLHSLEEISAWLIKSINDILDLMEESSKYNNNLLVYKVQKYVEKNYKSTTSLMHITKDLQVSYNYLSNLFNKETNMSFNDYLQTIRIEESKKLLLSSDMALTEIALEVGFSNQSYFTKIFKKMTGLSPGKYRKLKTTQEM